MNALLLWSTDTDIGIYKGTDTSKLIIILKNDIVQCNYLHITDTSNQRRVSDTCPCPTPTHMTIFNNVIFLNHYQCHVCVDASYLFWILNFNWLAELWVAIVTTSVVFWSIFATGLCAYRPWQFQWRCGWGWEHGQLRLVWAKQAMTNMEETDIYKCEPSHC